MANDPTLTDEELKRHEDRSWLGIPMTPVATRRLIAALRASRAEIEELRKSQITHEYDEETGYCLCTCCRHGI